MVYRYMFRGYPENFDLKLTNNPDVENVCAFKYGDSLVIYAESLRSDIKCEDIVVGEMKKYPDGSLWENMTEVFHYSVPQSDEDWKRKMPKEVFIKVNKLRHEKVSGYIFYHYQYQEENPCDGNKYGIMFISGDYIFFYLEEPEEFAERYKGTLDTHASPVHEEWAKLMNQHFDMDFCGGEWLDLERIL